MSIVMKRAATGVAAVVLMVMLAVFASGCGGDAAAASKYIAGTYNASGHGMGKIEINLTVDENAITDIEIDGGGETAGIGGKEAIEDGTFVEQIMKAQSAEIDGVTGATLTTNGIKDAVEDALEQAANPEYQN